MANWGSDSYLMQPFGLNDSARLDTDDARRARYQIYLDFYNGSQWLERRKPGERRLTVNYARTFIHKGASYLLGRPVKFELKPNGEGRAAQEEARQTEQALEQLWQDNNLAQLDYDTAVDAAILGDAAYKVTLQPQASNFQQPTLNLQSSIYNGPGPHSRQSAIAVRPVDVMGLTAKWRGDDMRQLNMVCEDYTLSGRELAELPGLGGLPPGGDFNTRYGVRERWTSTTFGLEVNGQVVREELNPYGFIPYVIFPNLSRPRQFWGLSDLEDIMSLNSEFNVRVSILSQLLQMSGNPVLVLENVESAEGLRVGPGAVWTLPEGAKAQLLEMIKEGGVGLHIQYIELLYKMMHDLSELPGAGFGRDNAANTSSGVALEQLLYPVVQRVQRKRRIWEQALDLRNRMMLALAGLPVHRSSFIWPDILPKDRAGLVTQEIGLVASNIHSLDTARRNLGDEQPELENEQIQAEWSNLGMDGNRGQKPAPTSSQGIHPAVHLSGALVQGLSNSGG